MAWVSTHMHTNTSMSKEREGGGESAWVLLRFIWAADREWLCHDHRDRLPIDQVARTRRYKQVPALFLVYLSIYLKTIKRKTSRSCTASLPFSLPRNQSLEREEKIYTRDVPPPPSPPSFLSLKFHILVSSPLLFSSIPNSSFHGPRPNR